MRLNLAASDSGRVAELVRLLADAERELAQLTGGEVDAIVDPTTAAPFLLRSAQSRLAESENKLRTLLARCPVLVIEITREGTLVYCNDAVHDTLGYPREFFDSHKWQDLLDDDRRGDGADVLRGFFAHGASDELMPMRQRDGEVRWIEWTTAPATTEDTMLIFGVDVTHRRELVQEQIARSEAEAANQAKSDFLAMMSHELRTPLNAISGYAQLLDCGIAGALTEPQHEYLSRIQRSQSHLLTMINDLIDFARLEAGRLTLNYGEVPVHTIVELCETLTTPQAAERGIDLRFEDCPPDLLIWADKDKVEQVLVNLVANALKFTPEGGEVLVEVRDADANVDFSVTDTGCGIPDAKLEAIFQPFVQVENGLTRSKDGAGLGLAISRALAREMGGDLRVRSTVASGSTFVLRLPKQPRAR